MMPEQSSRDPFLHYGWFIIITGTLGIFACLGLGRFALGMLLPTMATSLELSYEKMGLLSTSNFCGYLVGIIFAAPMTRRLGARAAATAGLSLAGISMAAISQSDTLPAIMMLYFLTGVGSALANIAIMALVTVWFDRTMRGKAAGIIVSGSGFAIIISGQLIPFIERVSNNNWRNGWLVLALLILAIALIVYSVMRNSPDETGSGQLGAPKHSRGSGPAPTVFPGKIPLRLLLHLGLLYAVFGFTFVSYATFIVTTMIQDYGVSQQAAGHFWSWVGIISLVSGPLAGFFSDKFNRKFTLAAIYIVHSLAFVLVGTGSTSSSLIVSICLFGIVAWSVPSTMAALCGDYAGPEKAVNLFSSITLIFALGQLAGPYFTGLMAQTTGNFSGGFILSAVLAGTAAFFSLLLPLSASDQ